MLWRNVPDDLRAVRYKRVVVFDEPNLKASYRSDEVIPFPHNGCLAAVVFQASGRWSTYRPCAAKAGGDGFCGSHRPDVLRLPPIPNIVGEEWA